MVNSAQQAGVRPAQWSSRFAFIMAAVGSAVGLGNIWKFPYITGENGGGAFVLVYLACIAVIGLPLMMAEVMLGRRGGKSPIGTMERVAASEGRSRGWVGVGIMATLAAFLILSFYSVIAGWTMPYIVSAASGEFSGISANDTGALFEGLLASPGQLLLWHSVFMGLTVLVSAGGVRHGLERAVTKLMPALFVLLLILVGYAMTTGHFGKAAAFLFRPDFSALTAEAVLVALGHAFFTLSLASGAMMAYGAYLKKEVSIARTSVVVAMMDTGVALLAGLAIFPIVFANGLEPGAGPGLIFVTLPVAFGQMPGGSFFATLFFVLLLFAAWSSSISMLESLVSYLNEKGVSRVKAAVGGGLLAWLVGITTVLSLNEWSGFTPLDMFARFEGKTLFDLYDYLTANIMMPLGALFTACFVGWKMKPAHSAAELGGWHKLWFPVIRYLSPIALLIVFYFNLK
ncbi:sodium:neurotransmitter symporter [Oceanimonas sp. GK1]|uniref:sodium-dependent transporter n=1 Tax=Oceanimonas sp. (strain GK1 / IBRC-M 10197) TaxID=511062 RepID=UPI000249506E|nr:sodium-dependent transporter [Oceanimonas sp. GK1]AEY02668.1 sodium:neurotransmitter symporter [Oceanimonas sp. GK1]